MLKTEQLCKQFGGLRAVNNIDFSINEGEVVAIIGPNGSGKTTFFNLISGIIPASGGRIVFKGEDVTGRQGYEITRRGMARTFQNIRLFPSLSARDNIIVGRYCRNSTGIWDGLVRSRRLKAEQTVNEEHAKELLEFVGLTPYRDVAAKNLPYGAQRRLEIARALASEPTLLLLDEPAAGMNPKEVDGLLSLVSKLKGWGVTILLIEHQMRLVMGIAERLVVFDHGEKIAEGLPQAVRHDPKVVEAYIGAEVNFHAED